MKTLEIIQRPLATFHPGKGPSLLKKRLLSPPRCICWLCGRMCGWRSVCVCHLHTVNICNWGSVRQCCRERATPLWWIAHTLCASSESQTHKLYFTPATQRLSPSSLRTQDAASLSLRLYFEAKPVHSVICCFIYFSLAALRSLPSHLLCQSGLRSFSSSWAKKIQSSVVCNSLVYFD